MESIDLDVENYSINEIITLLKLDSDYTTDDIHTQVDKIMGSVTDSTTIGVDYKKKLGAFFNSLRVILIRKINDSGGMHEENHVGHGGGGGGRGGDTISHDQWGFQIQKDQLVKEIKRELLDAELSNHIVNKEITDTIYTDTNVVDFRNIKYKRGQGGVNQIKPETITKCITFDTRFRDNYFTTESTDYKCSLPDKLVNVVSVQLSAFEFPTSYFIISDSLQNNHFSYQILGNGVVGEIKSIIIPSGNYSHTDLLSQINDRITANNDNIVFSVDITSLGSGTGKTIIVNNTVDLINVFFDKSNSGGVDDTPIPLKFGWILGFRTNEYVGNKEYISEGMYEDNGSRYIFLAVDDHNNNYADVYSSVFNSSMLSKNILARISIKTPAFHILNETGMQLVTEPRKYFGPVTISSLHIKILDEFGRVININNMDYSFCLNIESLYY